MQSIAKYSDKDKEYMRKAQQLIHQNEPTIQLQKQVEKEYEAPEYYKQMLTQEYADNSSEGEN